MAKGSSKQVNIPNVVQKQPSLVIRLNSTFGQLHKLAAESVFQLPDECKYTIFNSAVKDTKNGFRFQGPGQHVIVLIPPENHDANKRHALQALQTYVQHFVGYIKGINLSSLKPIWDGDGKTIADDDILHESQLHKSHRALFNYLFEDVDDEEEIGRTTGKRITGFYARFDFSTGTQKPSVFSEGSAWDQIKKSVTDFVDGISFQTYNWQNGPSGSWTTIKDVKRILSNAIDASKLPNSVEQIAKNEFNMRLTSYVEVSKTLAHYLSSRLAYNERQLLSTTKLSLCIKVHQMEKSYEFVSKQSIADLVTRSISRGFFAKVTHQNKFTPNDVILINNYSDNLKDKNNSKYLYSSQSYDENKDKFMPEWRAAANKLAKILKIIYVLLGYDAVCNVYHDLPDDLPVGASGLSKKSLKSIKPIVDKLSILSNGGCSGKDSISLIDLKNLGIRLSTSTPEFVLDRVVMQRALLKKSSIAGDPKSVKLTKQDAIACYQLDANGFTELYNFMLDKHTRASIDTCVNAHIRELGHLRVSNYPSSANTFINVIRNVVSTTTSTMAMCIQNLSNPEWFKSVFDDCIDELKKHQKFSNSSDKTMDILVDRNDINSKNDLYIIPMKNLEFDEVQPNTRFNSTQRS